MFNTTNAFKKQFTRVEGGYIVYPSMKDGGKPVSDAEYEQLVAGWKKVGGWAGQWKLAGAVIVFFAAWKMLSARLSAPEWTDTLLIVLIVAGVTGRMLWVSTAPSRLVKGRASVTAPRPATEARRAGRAALNWPFIVFALLLSGSAFLGSLITTPQTAGAWAWLIGSGALFGTYIWAAYKKLLDRRT